MGGVAPSCALNVCFYVLDLVFFINAPFDWVVDNHIHFSVDSAYSLFCPFPIVGRETEGGQEDGGK